MSGSDEGWTLVYWDVCPGRAEFLRLLFEEAGVLYTEVNDRDIIIKDVIKGEGGLYPHFAPPVIKKGKFSLSQTHVASRYLAGKFGLLPIDEEEAAHAEQVNLTCHDYIAEGRLAFHGIYPTGPYATQKETTQPYIDRFLESRLPRWLQYFERLLKSKDDGKGFVVGKSLSYADLGLLHVLRATEAQFPAAWEAEDVPALKAFKKRIEARPKLAAYLTSSRCQPFSGDSMM
ncbi:glutathione S-transferase P 1-like [Mya arenaria]|nr:glutathione S-transferase P 1-like [Mya arenaria]XP_052803823.1 glutathione S-transferase P 1-like [Mya arenaria]XP_052803832.1 glutathione S-transferase P 1-like [Mya arenaria]